MATATLYVTVSKDDAEEEDHEARLTPTLMTVADGFLSGLIFRAVPIPPGATVTAAFVRVAPYFVGFVVEPILTIRGEINPADWSEAVADDMTDRPKTSEGVIWDEVLTVADVDTAGYVSSPNIAAVIQQIIDYYEWAENDDIGLYLIDRGLGGNFYFYAYDEGPGTYPPALFLEWTVPISAETLDFAWPHDYWPQAYWPEYWPDYGTASPPAAGVAAKWMHYQRMNRRRGT